MKTLVNQNGLGLFFGVVESYGDNCVILVSGASSSGFNPQNSQIVDVEPPSPIVDYAWKYENGGWTVADQSRIDEYNAREKVLHNNVAKDNRAVAYTQTTDPLFFKAQRGEATMEEWLAAVQAIKDKYPYI